MWLILIPIAVELLIVFAAIYYSAKLLLIAGGLFAVWWVVYALGTGLTNLIDNVTGGKSPGADPAPADPAPEPEDPEEEPDQPEDAAEEQPQAAPAPRRVRYQEGDQLIWDEDLVEDEAGDRHLRYFDSAGELWDENLDDPDQQPKVIGTKGTKLDAYYHDKQGNRHWCHYDRQGVLRDEVVDR